MNPGHEALALVSEIVANGVKGGISHVREEIGLAFMGRARGIVLASRGLDGNGIRRADIGETGFCSSCGAYHELTGDPAEAIS